MPRLFSQIFIMLGNRLVNQARLRLHLQAGGRGFQIRELLAHRIEKSLELLDSFL